MRGPLGFALRLERARAINGGDGHLPLTLEALKPTTPIHLAVVVLGEMLLCRQAMK